MTTRELMEQMGFNYLDPEEHYDLMFGGEPIEPEPQPSRADLADVSQYIADEAQRLDVSVERARQLLADGEALLDEILAGRRIHSRSQRNALWRAILAAGRGA